MEEAQAPSAPAPDAGFDEIADALYAQHPDGFAGTRDERIRTARAAGQKELARALSALRRPTMSAWVLNLLWRDDPAVVEQFLSLAGALSRAQAEGSGEGLRRLSAQRRDMETALVRRTHVLAESASAKVTPGMEREVQETLAAALALPQVAAELRTGRLVKPASYAGFGDVTSLLVAPTATTRESVQAERHAVPRATEAPADVIRSSLAHEPAHSRGVAIDSAPSAPADDVIPDASPVISAADRAAQAMQVARDERRAEASRRLQTAQRALEAAAAELAEESRAAEAAQQHEQETRSRLDVLRREMESIEADTTSAARAAADAAGRRDEARARLAEALRTLEQAEQEAAESAAAG